MPDQYIPVLLPPPVFEFQSFDHWRDHAQDWFRENDLTSTTAICLDSKGRVCAWGRHFRRAEEEKTYPIRVYAFDRIRSGEMVRAANG